MPKKKKPELDDKEQSQRFQETAKELEVNEGGDDFLRAMEMIVASKDGGNRIKRDP